MIDFLNSKIATRLVLVLAALSSGAASAEAQVSSEEYRAVKDGVIPFELPQLPYNKKALAPYVDAKAMLLNHDHYHAVSVTNLNKSLVANGPMFYVNWRHEHQSDFDAAIWQWLQEMLSDPKSIPDGIREGVLANGGAHYNHTLFWQMMKPGGGGEPQGELGDAIKNIFGSFAAFQKQFTKAALDQTGNGWAWLTLDAGKLKIESTPNEDTPLSSGRQVLLGIDLWDHAYKEQYGSDRSAYVAAWFHVINWDFVADRYAKFKTK